MKETSINRHVKKIDVKLIDKAYSFCEQMFHGDTEAFQKYWNDNYVKFINDFAMKKYNRSALMHKACEDDKSTQIS